MIIGIFLLFFLLIIPGFWAWVLISNYIGEKVEQLTKNMNVKRTSIILTFITSIYFWGNFIFKGEYNILAQVLIIGVTYLIIIGAIVGKDKKATSKINLKK